MDSTSASGKSSFIKSWMNWSRDSFAVLASGWLRRGFSSETLMIAEMMSCLKDIVECILGRGRSKLSEM